MKAGAQVVEEVLRLVLRSEERPRGILMLMDHSCFRRQAPGPLPQADHSHLPQRCGAGVVVVARRAVVKQQRVVVLDLCREP